MWTHFARFVIHKSSSVYFRMNKMEMREPQSTSFRAVDFEFELIFTTHWRWCIECGAAAAAVAKKRNTISPFISKPIHFGESILQNTKLMFHFIQWTFVWCVIHEPKWHSLARSLSLSPILWHRIKLFAAFLHSNAYVTANLNTYIQSHSGAIAFCVDVRVSLSLSFSL